MPPSRERQIGTAEAVDMEIHPDLPSWTRYLGPNFDAFHLVMSSFHHVDNFFFPIRFRLQQGHSREAESLSCSGQAGRQSGWGCWGRAASQ